MTSKKEVESENNKLKLALSLAKKAIDEYHKIAWEEKSGVEKLNARVASIEMEKRKERIAHIIINKYGDDEKALEILAKSSLMIPDIHYIVTSRKGKK